MISGCGYLPPVDGGDGGTDTGVTLTVMSRVLSDWEFKVVDSFSASWRFRICIDSMERERVQGVWNPITIGILYGEKSLAPKKNTQ